MSDNRNEEIDGHFNFVSSDKRSFPARRREDDRAEGFAIEMALSMVSNATVWARRSISSVDGILELRTESSL